MDLDVEGVGGWVEGEGSEEVVVRRLSLTLISSALWLLARRMSVFFRDILKQRLSIKSGGVSSKKGDKEIFVLTTEQAHLLCPSLTCLLTPET